MQLCELQKELTFYQCHTEMAKKEKKKKCTTAADLSQLQWSGWRKGWGVREGKVWGFLFQFLEMKHFHVCIYCF